MIHDYKNISTRRRPAKTKAGPVRWHWHGAAVFVAGAVLAVLLVETEKSSASHIESPVDVKKTVSVAPPALEPEWEMETYEIELPPVSGKQTPVQAVAEPQQIPWQSFVVKPGYSLAILCSRAGVKPGEVHALMQLGEPVAALQKLYPNDIVRMKILPDGALAALEYDIHQSKRLQVMRVAGDADVPQFKAELINRPLEVRTTHATGVITDSLFQTARRAGLTDRKAIELAGIFAWDIDFALEVRKGDRFTVVYEQHYRAGEKIDDGPIIAAEFVNAGKVYRAVRYTAPDGRSDYYAPDGQSVRKTFLRNPVDFTRITSTFNLNRRHPILNTNRAHKGVDYGAPRGTAIRAAGDGKVVHRGRKGGYGRTIIIQHGQRYSTLYAHMSGYARNTQKGRKVKQGQIIGYVGQSGLATGPHLHYEFRIDGVHRNPLTVEHPSVEPVPAKYKEDFLAKTSPRVAQLDTLQRVNLALEQDTDTSPRI